ncbi:hypothetical protein EYR40_004614 [Pleurotus pulmonarius]|nr:hypothetical protein EYR40_004614 [Pleurotus pulmonarius]
MSAPVGNKLFHHHVLTTSPALDRFVISNPTSNQVITRTAAEIRNYIVVHHQAKAGNLPIPGGLPSDYLEFARAYNQEPNIWAKFAMPNADGSLAVSERDPHARSFGLYNDSLTRAFSEQQPAQQQTFVHDNVAEEREVLLQLLMAKTKSTLPYNKKKVRNTYRHNPIPTAGRPQGTVMRTLVPHTTSVPTATTASPLSVKYLVLPDR